MGVIVYVETNFLMSVALGRDARGGDLLALATSAKLRVAIPAGCYMEAFSAFEDEGNRRGRFRAELENQIAQLRRDITSPHAGELLRHLEESKLVNARLLDDVQDRLFRFVEQAAPVFEQIHAPPSILVEAVTIPLIADPTDNLILRSVLDHATRCPEETKALLTDNTKEFGLPEVRTALVAAGVEKHFRNAEAVIGWAGALTRQ